MMTIYDFDWDDQQDLGVWVVLPGKNEDDAVLVEASVRQTRDKGSNYDDEIARIWGEPTGDYLLAGEVKLKSSDGVATATAARPLYGAAARAALTQLVKIQNTGRQIPVNEKQKAILE